MTRYNPNLQIENTPQGRQAVFYAHTDTRHDLAAHAFYEVALPAQAGTLTVTLSALDRAHPSDSHVIGPRVDPTANSGRGSVTETYNLWPVTLILHSPDGKLVHTWKRVAGHSAKDTTTFTHEIPSGAGGTWRLRVTNDGAHASLIVVWTSAVSARGPLHTQTLPHRMFDGPLQVILEAISLKTDFEGDTLRLGFGQDLQDFAPGNDALGFHEIPLPSGVKADGGRLDLFEIETSSGAALIAAAQAHALATHADAQWLANATQGITPTTPVVHASLAFTDVVWTYDLDLKVDDLRFSGALHDLTVEVYVAFDSELFGGQVLALSPATFSGAVLEAALWLHLMPQLGAIIGQQVAARSHSALALVGHYLAVALSRMVHKDATFVSIRADASAWYVDVAWPMPMLAHLPTGVPGPVRAMSTGPAVTPATPTPPPPTGLGALPAEFVVTAPESLQRLDQINNIVVVMMENRSFDHLLGYLPNQLAAPGPDTNTVTTATSTVTVHRNKASDIIQGDKVSGFETPFHDFVHVRAQVADGAMTGFAQSYESRNPGHSDIVMAYYVGDDLPVYHDLATHYGVCDRWFAAHPGGTWPNRWTTLSGSTPMLNNPELTDPLIPYVPGQTIFSFLSDHGIDWRVFESDLSLVRTYDKHRLDCDRVVPFKHPRKVNRPGTAASFEEMAAAGTLPPVVFVEPNFSDTPPLNTACDDLFPTPPSRGQKFVDSIVKTLRKSPQWGHTLLVITYDEHGGFFDHVAPPGTAQGDPTWIGKVPKIHPEGADHLGIRVPAFVVSPWISPGSVCHQVFDHTSIIKTILLRHRNTIPAAAMTSFGSRVNQAAHLGVVLNQVPTPPALAPLPSTPAAWIAPSNSSEITARKPSDLAVGIRSSFLPPKPQ